MNTPIYDFLTGYEKSDILRCHMPGHKGKGKLSFDITEISGADSLFEANGIIAESECNMSKLYGSVRTIYSAGGSTLCIQTMLAVIKQENRRVFAVRNVHRAFLNAAALLDLEVEWIIPKYSGGILSGEIDLDEVEDLLRKCKEPSCIYVTSPDYTGKTADIAAISKICRKYDARLLVDNAHGAHLAFFPENIHPIALGADMCCDSAHKMLPALTGAAMLHTSNDEYAEKIKQAMSLFASTSPSYLIMASLDLCCKYISEKIRSDIEDNISFIGSFKAKFSNLVFADSEPFHITVRAADSGFNGIELAENLRRNGAECEYADDELLILLMSPVNTRKDYQRLEAALTYAIEASSRVSIKSQAFCLPYPEKFMSIRSAVFSPSEEIPVENSEGRICTSVKVPCPPAIPIAVSGEIISREHINIFKKYGILTVNVVQ